MIITAEENLLRFARPLWGFSLTEINHQYKAHADTPLQLFLTSYSCGPKNAGIHNGEEKAPLL